MTNEGVISRNNEAIQLLGTGMEHQAVGLLTQLLVDLKSVLAEPVCGMTTTTPPKDTSAYSMLRAVGWMCQEAVSLSALPRRCNFVYNKVFKLSGILEASCCEDECGHVFAAYIIFNLAVIHHNRGLQGDSLCMQKAVRLYEMCVRIVAKSAFDKFGPVDLLKAVALNNLAQVHFDLVDFQEGKTCLANLATILSSADLTDALTCDEYDGIVANVLLLKPPTVAAAA